MLHYPDARHVHLGFEFAQRTTFALEKKIEQEAARRISERLEHEVVVHTRSIYVTIWLPVKGLPMRSRIRGFSLSDRRRTGGIQRELIGSALMGYVAVNPQTYLACPVVALALGEVSQHEVEHAAVAEVLGFGGRVDSQSHVEGDDLTIRARRPQRNCGDRFAAVQRVKTLDRERLGAVEVVGRGAVTGLELQRQHAHAHEVGAVDSFVALDEYGLDAEQLGALGGPVATRP